MPFDAHANFAQSAVATAPSPADTGTSLVVASGEGAKFPAAPFQATVWPTGVAPFAFNAEIVTVTVKVGDTFTIVRQTELGGISRSILVGDQISAPLTAKTITDIENAIPSTAGLLSAVKVSAGASSANLSALTFSNSNGVSFGLSAGTITGSVETNYQAPGAYLTTAALSQDSSKYAGTNGAITGGSITVNTSGVSIDLPAYLTTAQPVGAYLTTARASTDAIGLNTAKSNVTWTVNSSGLSLDGRGYAGTGTSATNASLTLNSDGLAISVGAGGHNVTLSGNTAGVMAQVSTGTLTLAGGNNITLSQVGNAITISGPNAGGAQTGISGLAADGGTITSGTASFSNLNGVSFGIDGQTITASVETNYQSAGAYLTTAALSQDSSKYAGLNSAVTGGSLTVNTSGVSVNIPAYLQSVGFSTQGNTAGNTGFASQSLRLVGGNNITLSGSTAAGGLTLTISGPNVAGAQTGISGIAANGGTITSGTVSFGDSNGVTFGIDGQTITASVETNYQSVGAYLTTAALSQDSSNYAGTNGAITGGSITVDTSGVSVALPAYLTTADLSANSSKYVQEWALTGNTAGTTSSAQGTRLYFSGGNSLTISGNSNSLVFSVGNYITTQSGQAFSADASSTFQTLVFQDSNGVSWSNNVGSLRVTHDLQFTSATSAITSAAVHTSAARIRAIIGSDATYTSGSVGFRDLNGITWQSTTGQSLQITHGLQYTSATSAITSAALHTSASRVFNVVAATNNTGGGTASLSSDVSFSAANGLTFYTSAGNAIVGSHNALTTARASTDAVGLNTAQTNVTWTVNSSGLSLNAGGYAGTVTGATGASLTVNTSGVSINLPAYLTTADLSANSSKYVQEWALTGNTAGTTSSAQGTRLYFSGGNSITISGSSNSLVFSVGNYLTTARASTDAIGLNTAKTNVTWTVNSSGLSIDAGGYAGTVTGATGASLTVNSSGVSVNLPAYLTTADLSANSSKYVQEWALTGNTAGTTSSAQGTRLYFSGGNSITISGSSNSLVFSVGNYLTTARASTDAIGLNTAKTNVTWTANSSGLSLDAGGYAGTVTGATGASLTVNSSGVSVNLPAYLTTADLSANSSKYAQEWALTGNTAGTTSSAQGTRWYFSGGNSITISGNSNSLVFSVGNYITTARASTDAIGLNTAKTNVTWTVNSSGLSLDAGGYAGTTTGATNATVTLNTAGIAISVAAPGAAVEANWHTLQGNVVGSSSASGTTIAWSGGNGVTLSGTNNSIIGISVSTYDTVGTATTVNSVASANSVGTVTRWAAEDHRHAGVGGIGISTSGNTAGTTGSVLGTYWIQGGNNITVSQITSNNGSHTLVLSGGETTQSYYANLDDLGGMATGASAITQTSAASLFIQPFVVRNRVSAGFVRLLASFNDNGVGTAGTTSNAQTYSCQRFTTVGMVIYTQGVGASSRSIQSLTSTSAGITGITAYGGGANGSRYTITLSKIFAATGGALQTYTTSYPVSSASIVVSSDSNTLFTGPRFLDISWAGSLGPGNYWLGIGQSTSSSSNSSHISFCGTIGMAMSLNGVSQTALSFGLFGAVTSASDHQLQPGLGVWTTNASIFSKDSIALSQVSQVASNIQLPFQIIRSA